MACVIWCLVSLLIGLVAGFVIARLLDKRIDYLQDQVVSYKDGATTLANLSSDDVKLLVEYAKSLKEKK